ncbi:polysaccharide deacetylase family protein [Duganella sp. BJB488]|nr:polysaccharide deacetylase family protein [Duganella sp. BJB489]RFP24844.1 polysaccharide deacetylase family protein [Duganella sp. BJB488]RFP34079.1 polysaccharide deacetylase family protein [Duganella sp. BJB480]
MKAAAALTMLALVAAPASQAADNAKTASAANSDARDLNDAARAANAHARSLNGPARRAAEAKAAGIAAAMGAAATEPATAVTQAASAMHAAQATAAAPAAVTAAPAAGAKPQAALLRHSACKGTIYLTFDTGSQSQAELIADTLKRHQIKATFFLANEKTINGDYSLDPAWSAYWKARVAEGHAIGSHTFDHDVLVKDGADGTLQVKPGFGAHAGKVQTLTPAQYCEEIKRVDQRFVELTGKHLDPIWRAPAGRTSPRSLAAAQACGYAHVGWAPAGFSGDELSSTAYPNAVLLQKSLRDLRDGDIFVAHMGIWSRKDAWAPANLEPLISGLEQKGYCFATLREHPDYLSQFKPSSKHP